MPKYLAQVSYSADGVMGLLKEGGSSRRTAVEKVFASVGGKIEAYYYAFGQYDLFIVGDFPDDVTAAAASLIVNAIGAARVSLTVLLTPEQIDEAIKKHPNYRPPGQ